MSRFTCLGCRAGGVDCVQIRLPQIASRGSKLWRFSLFVRDYARARRGSEEIVTTPETTMRSGHPALARLIPMQDAKDTPELASAP